MRRLHVTSLIVALLLMFSASACKSAPTPAATAGSETAEKEFEDFDPNNFDRPTNIDNQWMPLKPGMRFVYEGTTVEDDGTSVPHRVEIHVTDLTKVIGGIRSVVSWDLDYSDDQLVEAELAFFAQDNDGNVWRMGEYPEAYEDGKLVEAPTWIHGFEDARAGIMMKADPQLGTPSYAEGWAPAVDWTDRGQVEQMGQKTCVPVDCYEDVLVITETSKSEPDAFQLKYYASGLGNVRVDWKGADATPETLELVEVVQLGPEALAEIRAGALELEKRAYEISKDVYAHTSPAEYPEGTPAIAVVVAETPQVNVSEGPLSEVVVYASDLPQSALSDAPTNTPTPTLTSTGTPRLTDTATPTPTVTSTPTPTATSPGYPVLVGAGDISSCDNNNDEATALLLDGIPGTVFTLGDNAYSDGTAADFANCYDPTWGRHTARTRPSPGNHDYHTSGASGYFSYFGAAAGSLRQGYYSYDLGAWHLIALNSNCSDVGGCGAGSPQEAWLRADLAAHPATCTLAYWHHPLFNSGIHGNHTFMQAMWQALYDYGADVVLNGHDHNYQRFAPQDPSGVADPAHGIQEFVVGTGGKSHYGFPGAAIANTEVRNDQTYGVFKLTLSTTSYSWQFIPVAGQTFTDSGSAPCH